MTEPRLSKLKYIILTLTFLTNILAYSQLNIPYVFLHKSFENKTITKSSYTIFSSPIHTDAKSIGRGKTNMMLGNRNNPMWQNPAFLSYEKFSIELTNAQLILPQSTLDAINFVREYDENFSNGKFIKDIRDGLNKMINGSTLEERKEGLAQYNKSIEFLKLMSQNIAYTESNPNIHGVSVFPKLQVQYKNWGVSLYKSMNIAFAVSPGNLLTALGKTQITEDLDWNQITEVAQLLYHSFDSNGNISANGLPRIFAISFDDWIGIVGYGRQINKNFRLGANIKFINRGFSTDAIDSKDAYNALEHANDNLKNKFFFVTADIGGLYELNNKKTTIGFNFRNIIPSNAILSEAQFNYTESKIEIPKDENGVPLVGRVENNEFIEDPTGDTLIYSYIIDKKVIMPFELKTPFLFELGVHHKLINNLDVNMDLVDIFAQDSYYFDSYFERLRIGAEYRFFHNIFALRAGMADYKPTFGIGINLYAKNIVLDLDLAYAQNKITNTPAYFIQLNIGYRKNYKDPKTSRISEQ